MLSSYRESIRYLYGLQKYGIKFGLNCTENLLARLGNPHRAFRSVHVAGTNGKGSTAAMLSSVLKEHGLQVGLYTSPHLVRFTERFRMNDTEVSPERIMRVFGKIYPLLDQRVPPTFFEVVTAMAFAYFAEENADWAVIEVGMGGRLDATNVIKPRVSVVTNISFDHQEFLGSTLSSIAREKAGIIKTGVPVVTGARQPVVQGILKAACLKHKTSLFSLGRDFRVRRNGEGTFQYVGMRRRWSSLKVPLEGPHQTANAALALAALEILERQGDVRLDPAAVQRGLSRVLWPARLEILQDNPLVILDGAHNPQGAESLRDALKNSFSYRHLHLVMGVMADKDIRGIFRRLLPLAETAVFTQPRYARAANPEELRRLARSYIRKHYVIPDPASAIQQAKLLAGPEDLICITGSLYFAGEVKELYGEPTLPE
ncbi:MAG TPA: folylpolyglutamate synthase/dihydrofolate synthase family protein [Syntrophobacteraceae bacterium]|nr:folylpolyglutamate synthase/dihydrofolate synthase family protein [Syntrophobacteraceae bacterium]